MRNLIKKIRRLHFHKWELVYTGHFIKKYFYKCSICGEYSYNFNNSNERYICDESECDSARGYDLWRLEDIEIAIENRRKAEIINKIKAESKRRCRR